jgi:hypothetical protein
MSITLSAITVYPIKGCGGVDLTQAELEPRGLRYDRRWMVVDENRQFVTQRDFPRMTLIAVTLASECLRVEAPGMPQLSVPLETTSDEHVDVHVWSDTVKAVSVGKEAAEWFSTFLGTSCTLVAMTGSSLRRVDTRYARNGEVVSFADAFPLLLIAQSSLDELNVRLATPVPMRRFRPNLVVEGCEPFAEDTWKEIRIGDVPLHVVKPCARCVVTTVDTRTGEKGEEPLRTLATFRSVGNKVMFGQNLLHAANGTLRVGDTLVVER